MTLLKRLFHWMGVQTKQRPFLSALVILALVFVPGFFRLEEAINKANSTANQVAVLAVASNAREHELALTTCQTRNAAQKNSRDRFESLFTALETILTSDPTNSQSQNDAIGLFVDSLRQQVPLDPSLEDIDCDQDGQLAASDYG